MRGSAQWEGGCSGGHLGGGGVARGGGGAQGVLSWGFSGGCSGSRGRWVQLWGCSGGGGGLSGGRGAKVQPLGGLKGSKKANVRGEPNFSLG